jgi:hypothetical protein
MKHVGAWFLARNVGFLETGDTGQEHARVNGHASLASLSFLRQR